MATLICRSSRIAPERTGLLGFLLNVFWPLCLDEEVFSNSCETVEEICTRRRGHRGSHRTPITHGIGGPLCSFYRTWSSDRKCKMTVNV